MHLWFRAAVIKVTLNMTAATFLSLLMVSNVFCLFMFFGRFSFVDFDVLVIFHKATQFASDLVKLY